MRAPTDVDAFKRLVHQNRRGRWIKAAAMAKRLRSPLEYSAMSFLAAASSSKSSSSSTERSRAIFCFQAVHATDEFDGTRRR